MEMEKAWAAAKDWEDEARRLASLVDEAERARLTALGERAPAVFWAWGKAFPDRALRLARGLDGSGEPAGALATLCSGTAYLGALAALDGRLPFSLDIFTDSHGESGSVDFVERWQELSQEARWPRAEDEGAQAAKAASAAFEFIAPASSSWIDLKNGREGGSVRGLDAMEEAVGEASFARAIFESPGAQGAARVDCAALARRLEACREEDELRAQVGFGRPKEGWRL